MEPASTACRSLPTVAVCVVGEARGQSGAVRLSSERVAARSRCVRRLVPRYSEVDGRPVRRPGIIYRCSLTRSSRHSRFPVRVFDLGMMGYSLVGGCGAPSGRVHTIGSHASALWAYRGSAGSLLCQMYTGSATELPPHCRDAHGQRLHLPRLSREGRNAGLLAGRHGRVCLPLRCRPKTRSSSRLPRP